jgi:hypothetical protein
LLYLLGLLERSLAIGQEVLDNLVVEHLFDLEDRVQVGLELVPAFLNIL